MNPSTVLIVDDEKNIRSSLQRALVIDGHHILQAENAEEALELLDCNEVKLVISDMRMPGMDGADLLKKVAERHKGVRRMVLTGYGDLSRAIAAINEGGVHRFLTKPWDNDELRKAITEELEAEKNERDQENRIDGLRINILQLSEKMKTAANLLSGTTEILKHSQYNGLIGLQLTLAEFQTPLKAELAGRVQKTAERIAIDMQMDPDAREILKLAAMLHRIGEYALPVELVRKCWRDMTDSELSTYHTYPEISTSLVDSADCELVDIISTHRRYLNGQGFPSVGTDEIPLGGRILCAATEYEETKLFKGHQMDPGAIRELMLAGAGGRYDEKVVASLCRVQLT